ncbi:class III extradiol ring-cleavage dioxygenase [Dialister sp.]|uniref:dioxygenase family protein n=1 Tax=Dialister sp. TaxID=1955814 RepID=UPI002580355E|nr:class III extradiol ring-cleavage dioxygenase [Dialister sp.]
MMKLPVIFAGHGSPMIALEDNELTKEFQKIGERVVSEFEKPKAILSFSAHWFTRGTYVQSDPEPRQVYDMYGFPKELYEVQYHPKGCQELTDDILALLPDISINDDWGIEGPQNAYDIGKALAPLREKGYLLLGSGNIVHNLRRLEWDTPTAPRRPTASTPSSRGSSKRETTKKSSTTKTTPTPPRQPTTSSPYFIH